MAFMEYSQIMNTTEYDYIIKSVFNFIEKDVPVLMEDDRKIAFSYSPLRESRIVVNANAYILCMYSLFLKYFPANAEHIRKRIKKLYNFIAEAQNKDGSWFYYADTQSGNFIDCFHSCFVMENLFKADAVLHLDGAESLINKGFRYLEDKFFDKKMKLFRRFSISDKLGLTKFDLYDNAEALNLLVLLKEKQKAGNLLKNIEDNFIVGNDIYSVIDIMNIKRNKNMLRWAVMPFVFAYSNYQGLICAES